MRKRRKAPLMPAPDKEGANPEGANPEGANPAHATMSEAETRHALMRNLTMVMNRWRECPARVCRRARRCAGPDFACTTLPPRRPRRPENDAAVISHFHKMLRRRLAEIGRGHVPPKPRKPSLPER